MQAARRSIAPKQLSSSCTRTHSAGKHKKAVSLHLGGVGMMAAVSGIVTVDFRCERSPRAGGLTIVNVTCNKGMGTW